MMPRISPSTTSKLTSATARRPPKERESPWTWSSGPDRRADGGSGAGASAHPSDAGFTSGATAVGETPWAASRRSSRSRIVQKRPSGDSSMIVMIAMPYTTPWIPGR